ncbi:MAG: DMT family transporter [Coriobacteriaceae bacterium]|nr:DMT family transporter [Coriobacteriaceae bacterium]
MRFGVASGVLWGLDTVVLGMALSMAPYFGTAEALAFAAVVSSLFHDAACAVWMMLYMLVRGQLKLTLKALKTRSAAVVAIGALLGGPIGMTGYLLAISNIGPAYTAIISAFYPAFGAILSFILLKERMKPSQILFLCLALIGIMVMGWSQAGADSSGNPVLGLAGACITVVGWGSEAVLCAWGMRAEDAMNNETALQIRETVSSIAYALVVIPLFGGWGFAARAFATPATALVAAAGLAGVSSYLFYYKGISVIGPAKAMALNISYSAWAVIFGVILLGNSLDPLPLVCCAAILVGTIGAACDLRELAPIFRHKEAQ